MPSRRYCVSANPSTASANQAGGSSGAKVFDFVAVLILIFKRVYMSHLSQEQLHERACYRAAWVLCHFWQEQREEFKPGQSARTHSRIFDTLVHASLINEGTSINGGGHLEHLVPCALLRDRAFEMFHLSGEGEAAIQSVAKMLQKYLRVAKISKEEAKKIDFVLGHKTKMPDGWNFETGCVMARLDAAGVQLVKG